MSEELKPCPFCGGTDIKISFKTMGDRKRSRYHAVMFCNSCHAYGPRTIIEVETSLRPRKKEQLEHKPILMKAWNNRSVDND